MIDSHSVRQQRRQGAAVHEAWKKFGWLFAFLAGLFVPPALIAFLWLRDVLPIGVGSLVAVLGSPLWVGLAIGVIAGAALLVATLGRWIIRRRGGREFAASILFCVGVVVAIYPGLFVGHGGKQLVARYLAERGDRVAAAIEHYMSDRKQPPRSLTDLVPDYLPAIPTTGSARYPEYTYRVGPDAPFGNAWSLEIEMFEFLKWDALYFCPKQNCLGLSGGGTIPMGRWVFLDE
jgi:hypothetical protein